MTAIQSLEDAVVALLVAFFTPQLYPTVAVGPLPTSKSENTTIGTGQQIWALIHQVKAGPELSGTSLFQETVYQFGISVESRQLRENLGTYNLIDLVNKALLGKRPITGSGWLRLAPQGWVNKGEQDGVFTAFGLFECPGIPVLANFDTSTGDGPPLTNTTFVQN